MPTNPKPLPPPPKILSDIERAQPQARPFYSSDSQEPSKILSEIDAATAKLSAETPPQKGMSAFEPIISSLRTSKQLTELTLASATLNSLSDQLTREVSAIEGVINNLNLGVQAEVHAHDFPERDKNENFYSHWLQLAYGKSEGKWGLVIEELTEDVRNPERDSVQRWPFRDAPRDFRLKVIEKVPALLDALVQKSNDVAEEITKKVQFVRALASTFPKSSPSGSKK